MPAVIPDPLAALLDPARPAHEVFPQDTLIWVRGRGEVGIERRVDVPERRLRRPLPPGTEATR